MASVMCALVLTGCGAAPAPKRAGTFRPPPPLALVVIVDPSPAEAAGELRQLEAVIQHGATPSQTFVVSLLSSARVLRTYVVRAGDSLSAIAGAQGVSLAALEGANPQLGPLANRRWDRLYPGDRVTVPAVQTGGPAGNAIVTRAPAGPAPPTLARLPERPANATTFHDAQYRRALAAAELANKELIAAWQAQAARDVRPWQTQVVGHLRELAASLGAAAPATTGEGGDLAASVQAAVNVLGGLPGRRVLLLLAGERIGPADGAALGASVGGIHLVVANLPDRTVAAFTSAAATAGATVTALGPALTELQLATTVNG